MSLIKCCYLLVVSQKSIEVYELTVVEEQALGRKQSVVIEFGCSQVLEEGGVSDNRNLVFVSELFLQHRLELTYATVHVVRAFKAMRVGVLDDSKCGQLQLGQIGPAILRLHMVPVLVVSRLLFIPLALDLGLGFLLKLL